jgi:alkylhydroperoxidase family enzyme
MSRIPLVPLDLAEPRAIVEAMRLRRGGALSNLDRLLLNSPPLAESWNAFLGTVRQKLSLSPKVREIVMCGVAVLNKAEYEFFHHVKEFEKAGGTPAQIDALRDLAAAAQNAELFDAQERIAFEMTAQMTSDIEVSDDTLTRAAAVFSRQGLVDLIATIAVYNMVSRVVVACDIRPEH